MNLIVKSVKDPEFKQFGRIVDGYDYKELLQSLEENSEKPSNSVIYVPSVPELEGTKAFKQLADNCYGGMPIQIGYCNGANTKLNCMEYHRDSEVDIANDDVILLLASQQDIISGKLDTSKVQAFLCEKGTAVELYATTLHYAPCSAKKGEGFRVVIVLPKNTNTDKPEIEEVNEEDSWLWARNKWLLAHKDSSEASQGAYIGLVGENIDITGLI